MVQIPKNPCPNATQTVIQFGSATFAVTRNTIVAIATSDTTRRIAAGARDCFLGLCSQLRHSRAVESCLKRFSGGVREFRDLTILEKDASRVPAQFHGFRIYFESGRYTIKDLTQNDSGGIVESAENNAELNGIRDEYATQDPSVHFRAKEE